MSTPLTNANVASLTKAPDCFCEADFARRLERDRAALMEALEGVLKYSTPTASAKIDATRALSTARTNFPTP